MFTVSDASFGIDLGSYKITVCKSLTSNKFLHFVDQPDNCNNNCNDKYNTKYTSGKSLKYNVPNTSIVADFMGSYKIPNRISLPKTISEAQPRYFGNNVNKNKNIITQNQNISKMYDTYQYDIYDKKYDLPNFYTKNMILSHVTKIIKKNVSSDKNIKVIGFVPYDTNSLTDMNMSVMGIKSVIMGNLANDIDIQENHDVKLIPVSNKAAMIMSYVQRHIIQNQECLLKKSMFKNVILVDVGNNNIEIVDFDVHVNVTDTGIYLTINENLSEKRNCSINVIDGALLLHIQGRIRKINPSFNVNSVTLDTAKDIKHQLSSMKNVNVSIHDIHSESNASVSITISRDDLNNIIASLKINNSITDILDAVVGGDVLGTNTYNIYSKLNSIYNSDNTQNVTNTYVEIIGGNSRIPYINELVTKYFADRNYFIGKTLNPDEAIAEGASFCAWLQAFGYESNISVTYNRPFDMFVEFFDESSRGSFFGDKTISHKLTATQMNNGTFSYTSNYRIAKSSPLSSLKNTLRYKRKLGSTTDTGIIDINIKYDFSDYITKYKKGILSINHIPDISVVFSCSMVDTIDVSAIIFMGKKLDFEQYYGIYTNTGKYKQTYNMIDYIKTEKIFVDKDEDMVRRGEIINFMEDYHINKDVINKTISNAQVKLLVPLNSRITSVNDVIPSDTKLLSPIKELYEFYRFCDDYFYVEEDVEEDITNNIKVAKRKLINDLLLDHFNILRMFEAISIIQDIKSSYQ